MLTLACTALSSCSGDDAASQIPAQPEAGGGSSVVTSTESSNDAGVAALVAATQQLDGRIAVAISERLAKCMEQAGFTYPYSRPQGPFDDRPIVAQYFGPVDQSTAEMYGYSNDHFQSRFPREPPPGGPEYLASLVGNEENRTTPDLLDSSRTITATFSDGCLGAARAEIFGSQDDWARYSALSIAAGDLVERAVQRTLSDTRFTSAVDDWSACMSERGFAYESPSEPAISDWTSDNALEGRVIQADIDCKDEVQFVDRWNAVFGGHAEVEAQANLNLLSELGQAVERLAKDL